MLGNEDVIAHLLRSGADPNTRSRRGTCITLITEHRAKFCESSKGNWNNSVGVMLELFGASVGV